MRPTIFALASLVFFVPPSWAWARTWTDARGRQIEAEFVRVHNGRAVLKQGAKVHAVPWTFLSEKDQDYLRERLKEEGKEHLAPKKIDVPGSSPSDSAPADGDLEPGAEDDADKVEENRTWTDLKGNQIVAGFAGIEAGRVVLDQDGLTRDFPFQFFSLSDQAYVRRIMEGRGLGHLVPAPPGSLSSPPSAAAPPMVPGSRPGPNTMAGGPRNPPFPSMPGMRRDPGHAGPSHRPTGPSHFPGPGRQASVRSHVPTPSIPARSHRPRMASHRPSRIRTPRVEMPDMSVPRPCVPHPEMVYEKRCLSCNRAVPDSSKAGDRCPHCGVYWSYEEGPGGKKIWAPYAAFSGVGVVIVVLFGVLAKLLKG